MFRVFDVITADVLDYDDIDDFRTAAKFSFDNSVHDAIDEMCDAYKRNECMEPYEQYLGIRVVSDMTLDTYDLIQMYR